MFFCCTPGGGPLRRTRCRRRLSPPLRVRTGEAAKPPPSLSGGFQGVPEPFELNGCPFRTSCVPGEEVLLDHRKLTHSLSLSLSSGEMVLDLEVEKRLCLSMLTTTQSKWRMLTFAVRMPRVTDWQLCLTSGNLNSSPHAWVTNTSPFEPFPQPLILVLF